MMTERGVAVDHSTLYRWVQHFAPKMGKRLRWQWRRPQSRRWRIDETYVKVRGKWAYLYRAVDKLGTTIDLYLSSTRNTKAAKRFLGKALRGMKDWELPSEWHRRRGQARRARLQPPTVRSDLGHGVATGPLGQRRNIRRPPHPFVRFAKEPSRLLAPVSTPPPVRLNAALSIMPAGKTHLRPLPSERTHPMHLPVHDRGYSDTASPGYEPRSHRTKNGRGVRHE